MSPGLDSSLVGETAADLMDSIQYRLDENDLPTGEELEGKIVAVGIVVCIEDEADDGGFRGTFVRIKCSSDRYHEQLGLFAAAMGVLDSA